MSGVDWQDYQGEDKPYVRAKKLDTGIDKRPAVSAHTVVTRADTGQVHVQHFGPSHVLDGSVQEVWLQPGETVVIRHVTPRTVIDGEPEA